MQYTENEIVGVARIQKIENTLHVAILSLARNKTSILTTAIRSWSI
jgi:hypothetical protein